MIHLQATKDQVLLGPTTAATTTRSASFDWSGADYASIRVFQSASAGTNGGCSISRALRGQRADPGHAVRDDHGGPDGAGDDLARGRLLRGPQVAKRYGKVILTPTTNTNDSIITTATLTLGASGTGAEQHHGDGGDDQRRRDDRQLTPFTGGRRCRLFLPSPLVPTRERRHEF
jgi:hypothetical protein